ncbi:uncharacterized protein IL334_003483 [Kwoniella shivajii]|uniref:Polysaccharide lyase 14 domain-containing protein n=1 Tax=Kwoniella shivajii TaxID=564305 RepID=A0ABZ1CYX6_9TREE|nr:hypothetical protein IL334_003483 [Kwoniella shivajii]
MSLSPISRWISTLPLLLLPLAAAVPLPSDSGTSSLSVPTTRYPVITNAGTIRYTSSSPSTITATSTSAPPTITAASFDTQWDTYPTAVPSISNNDPETTMVPVLVQQGDTSSDAYGLSPTPTSSWALPPMFSDMSPFNVSTYAAGKPNIAILSGSPESGNNTDGSERWDPTRNALQILYPSGSVNPGNSPQGGAEFYSAPLDIRKATNASLEYSVYFPPDFDFVKGGKLPGLYGGHKGCSGGNAAEDCFSTRLMWRAGGQGELYLYAPKDKQTPSLCQTPPKSICESEYGLSIGRGSWKFALGDWTTVRQDVWLNTPGQNDGGFNIWVNGQLVISANDVRYRENGDTCLQGEDDGSSADSPMINTIGFLGDSVGGTPNLTNSVVDEDWLAEEQMISMTSTSISTITVTSTIPPISAYSTGYTPEPTITSSPTAGSSSSVLRKRQDDDQSQTSDPTPSSISEHDMVITIPVTEGITTVTATAPTAYITVPTTMTATSTVINEVQVTVTPSASTVYVTEDSAAETWTPVITASNSAYGSQPTGSGSDGGSIVLRPQSLVDQVTEAAPLAATEYAPLQPIILKSPPGRVMSSSDLNTVQAQSSCGVGFIGLFFSTFFGGHTSDWASPKDQYTYFRDFKMWFNN